MSVYRALLVAAFAAATARDGSAFGQQPEGTTVLVNPIRIEVTATDGRGRYQTGLSAADFEVLEDGQPQKIEVFEEAKTPLNAILLMDTSQSMGKNLLAAQEAAVEFVRQMRPEDEATVMEFNTFVKVSQPTTSKKPDLESAIRTMTLSGATALLNAVRQALVMANEQRKKDDSRRPAIILLSDGDDTASAVTSDLVVKTAREAEVPVFAVRIFEPPPASRFDEHTYQTRLRESPGAELLDTIARETGGRFILARLSELKRFYADVANELHSQYRLGYISTNRKLDGRWRTVTVRVKSRDNLRLKYRPGYFSRTR